MTQWITSHPDHLTDEEKTRLGQVKAGSPHLNATAGHVTAFAEMMTGRHGERLPAWIAAVDLDDLPSLHSFTRGIRRDQIAVTNGLTPAHSSGAVEGNVTNKALKRQMFGRANLDLLVSGVWRCRGVSRLCLLAQRNELGSSALFSAPARSAHHRGATAAS